MDPNVESRGDNIRNLTRENHDYLEAYPWYLDYINRRFNAKSVQLFTKKPMYRNKVATSKTMAINNYLRAHYVYQEEVQYVSERLDQGLYKS